MISGKSPDLPAYGFVARVAGGDLDGVLMSSEHHFLACWTMMLSGKREVVALEIRPKRRSGHPGRAAAANLIKEWLLPATQSLAKELPKEPAPVTTALVRAIPLGQVMAARQEALEVEERANAAGARGLSLITPSGSVHEYPKLRPSELDHLLDAATYADAVNRGSRSPAVPVAERRGIDVRSAHNRIAKARRLGYLTQASHGKVGGELTPKAKKLIADVTEWAALQEQRASEEKGGTNNG